MALHKVFPHKVPLHKALQEEASRKENMLPNNYDISDDESDVESNNSPISKSNEKYFSQRTGKLMSDPVEVECLGGKPEIIDRSELTDNYKEVDFPIKSLDKLKKEIDEKRSKLAPVEKPTEGVSKKTKINITKTSPAASERCTIYLFGNSTKKNQELIDQVTNGQNDSMLFSMKGMNQMDCTFAWQRHSKANKVKNNSIEFKIHAFSSSTAEEAKVALSKTVPKSEFESLKIMLLIDMTNPQSFEEAKKVVDNVTKDTRYSKPKITLVVIKNKDDSLSKEREDEIKIYAKTQSLPVFNVKLDVNNADHEHGTFYPFKQLADNRSKLAPVKAKDHFSPPAVTRVQVAKDDHSKQKTNCSYEPIEVAFIIGSLGLYAYLRNCVGLDEDLTTPANVAKIALAMLCPPVAMVAGIFSLFCSPKNNNEAKKSNVTKETSPNLKMG